MDPLFLNMKKKGDHKRKIKGEDISPTTPSATGQSPYPLVLKAAFRVTMESNTSELRGHSEAESIVSSKKKKGERREGEKR